VTAPFVYVRVMGASETEAKGYSEAALDTWAERVGAWATGRVPAELETVSDQPAAKVDRDVFLYVISGFKARNPAAAMALIERLA
jgi:uncharacterized protein YecE (DUF72 family)